jgi:hypothetical protein
LAQAQRVRAALSEPLDTSTIDPREAQLAIAEWARVEAQAAARRLKLIPGCDRPPAWTEAHHHWVHAQNIHIRRKDGHTQYRINGIWQTNHRWRP